MELTREHFRAIIFHGFRRELTRQECIDELTSLYGDGAPSYSTVKNWYNEFNRGRRSLEDEGREGRPKTVVVPENIDAVHELTEREEAEIVRKVKKNPRLSAPELKAELFADHGKTVSAQTVRRTIKSHGYNGKVARKKPLLAERNRKLRKNFALEYSKKDQSWWDDVIFLD
ncbi:histone-lysine N-methyltransferase SETMAR-like [Drosophila rhopaloa]|uniref:Transposase n=1 Tax=Drosophila rhopaloa TaxID=1041015 RepID=A0ABM5J2M1_DRORH|nr:histone-lysine N-methyltransferase SETMAR-like [Drosophila rhopaloa]